MPMLIVVSALMILLCIWFLCCGVLDLHEKLRCTCSANDMLAAVKGGDLHEGVRPVEQLQALLQLRQVCRPRRLYRHSDNGRSLRSRTEGFMVASGLTLCP